MKPEVSIIMPVYNAEKYIDETMQSILGQTYKNFELIIIDDGSTDRSADIIQSYKDKRIIFTSRENKGQTATLNEAIKLVNGKYIARHDADDVSMKNRLQEQVSFMERNPDIDLLGTNYEVIHEDGKLWFTTNLFTNPDDIKLAILFSNQFGHGTIMARRSVFENNGYDESFQISQDYDLWGRIARTSKPANLQKSLYQWRYYEKSLSTANARRTEEEARRVRERECDYFIRHRSEYKVLSFHPSSINGGVLTYCSIKGKLLRNLALMHAQRGLRVRALWIVALACLYNPFMGRAYSYTFFVITRNRHRLKEFGYET